MNGPDWSKAWKALAVALVGLSILGAGAQETGQTHRIPFFPSASDAFRTGFARVVNHSAEAGEVRIDAVDDEGESYGPVVLSIGAGETAHFNSDDLENGNAEKDLSGATDSGEGDWRLQLTSDLDIEVLSYIRTGDGFLTAMHDTVPSEDGKHRVAFFNPGSNHNQVSGLRLVNPGEDTAEISIAGFDDEGESPGSEVTTTILAGASRTFTAAAIESIESRGAGEGLEGALGDGEGKWRLMVESEQPVVVMSLLSDPMGYLTNLSTAPGNEAGGVHFVPFMPDASDTLGRQGFVRVINHSTEPGDVRIDAVDDEGQSHSPVMLAIDASETVHFNSDDLESGNAAKGLSGAVGPGQGAWRLELSSELDIAVLSYVRTSDGFVTAMHDVAPSEDGRHRIAFFNPASNASQVSWLRLVNPGEEEAEVSIVGIDDRGESPGGEVTTTIPAGASRTFTAVELESGGEGLEGALGDGTGKWRLMVQSVQPADRRDEPALEPDRPLDQPVDRAGAGVAARSGPDGGVAFGEQPPSGRRGDVHAVGDGAKRRGCTLAGHGAALLPLVGRDNYGDRPGGGHRCGGGARRVGERERVGGADCTSESRNVLLRRVRGRGGG